MSDWDAVLDVIHTVYMVDDLDQFGPTVLEQVETLIPSDQSSYNEVDPVALRAVVVSIPDPITDADMEIWRKWAHQNPALMHMLRTGDGSPRRISDFLTQEEFHRLELYQLAYGRIGVEYQLSVGLATPHPLVVGVALNRATRDFTSEEVLLLDALRPHLVQAYRQAQLLTERRRALDRIAGALEQDGQVFHVMGEPLSDKALALLSGHFGPTSEQLPESLQAWVREERAGFEGNDPGRLRQPLVSQRDGHRLTVRFVPGVQGPDLLWLTERPTELDSEPLRRLGLSDREAEVLWLLTKGRSTAEISRDLSIALGTAKKHLEHVYRKLGVSTATAAVAAAFDALSS